MMEWHWLTAGITFFAALPLWLLILALASEIAQRWEWR